MSRIHWRRAALVLQLMGCAAKQLTRPVVVDESATLVPGAKDRLVATLHIPRRFVLGSTNRLVCRAKWMFTLTAIRHVFAEAKHPRDSAVMIATSR